MADVMQVLEAGTYAAFIAGAIFAIWQLFEMRRDRGTQLVLSMINTVISRDVQEMARKVFDSEYETADEAEKQCGRMALMGISGYFEGLGYLVRRGMISGEAVFETEGFVDAWEKIKPWALKQREIAGSPYVFDNFEYAVGLELAYEAKKRKRA